MFNNFTVSLTIVHAHSCIIFTVDVLVQEGKIRFIKFFCGHCAFMFDYTVDDLIQGEKARFIRFIYLHLLARSDQDHWDLDHKKRLGIINHGINIRWVFHWAIMLVPTSMKDIKLDQAGCPQLQWRQSIDFIRNLHDW